MAPIIFLGGDFDAVGLTFGSDSLGADFSLTINGQSRPLGRPRVHMSDVFSDAKRREKKREKQKKKKESKVKDWDSVE